ncbi:hypothetical protein CEXT_545401 [Caerostris extrusa]|uniref:Uncharacterized protein n=1 Tax=Caerostris extrusa TaxID=172846 RepID=A0AAV4S6N6_CAEEX|nr:hypothetical protein CEXT_545401 [Caerostris extrusa]
MSDLNHFSNSFGSNRFSERFTPKDSKKIGYELEGFNIDFKVVNKGPSDIRVSFSRNLLPVVVVAYLIGSMHHAIKRIISQLQGEEEHIAPSRGPEEPLISEI